MAHQHTPRRRLSSSILCWCWWLLFVGTTTAPAASAFLPVLRVVLQRKNHPPQASVVTARWQKFAAAAAAAAGMTAESVGLRGLYPPSHSSSVRNGTLAVDDVHTLYYELHGSGPLLALFLHGGPGAGCNARHATFFDTANLYTVVLLDQRGSGRSTPRGETGRNTLLDLVDDCERLRRNLRLSSDHNGSCWDVVLGGSWGATLAIAYAARYPNSVRSLILRGVCLMRKAEIDWLFADAGGDGNGCCARLFPEAWKKFAEAVGGSGNNNNNAGTTNQDQDPHREVLHAYYDRLLGEDPTVRLAACRSWMQWEMKVFSSSLTNATSAQAEFYSKAYAPVAVWDPTSATWFYRDGNNTLLDDATRNKLGLPIECETAVNALRVGLRDTIPLALQPAKVRHLRRLNTTLDNNHTTNSSNTTLSPEYASFIPAQNMLTCFYSVNNRYALNDLDLLSSTIPRIHNIPCIAVQGGLDRVCPPDTALDVLHQQSNINNMELRIPLQSGHSMYDVAIANELVRATERMAKRLLTEKKTAAVVQ